MVLIRAQIAITIRKTAVTVYFRSTQLLPFAFARQRIGADNYPANKNMCMTFIQRRPNVFDVGPTLYKC